METPGSGFDRFRPTGELSSTEPPDSNHHPSPLRRTGVLAQSPPSKRSGSLLPLVGSPTWINAFKPKRLRALGM